MTYNILAKHQRKYPHMERSDELKLFYQACYGPGHLISNPDESLEYLLWEIDELKKHPPVYHQKKVVEDIGNDFVRIYLEPFMKKKYNPLNLNEALVLSANKTLKNPKELFLSLAKEEPLHHYHHSANYKKLYDPHYRVINREYLNILRRK
jgi:hypothetical protein